MFPSRVFYEYFFIQSKKGEQMRIIFVVVVLWKVTTIEKIC